jgi:hypothetical protein
VTFNNNREAIQIETRCVTRSIEHAAVIHHQAGEEDGKTTVFFTMLPPGKVIVSSTKYYSTRNNLRRLFACGLLSIIRTLYICLR